MKPHHQNRRSILLIFVLVAVAAYFILPRVQQYIPLIGGKTLAEIDAITIPSKVTILSEREILNDKNAQVLELPAYLVCSIDDDPDGTNAYGIYDPTDLAVTVSNLIRLNTKHLFLGTHLHWPNLPPLENNTLNTQLELLDSCILSTPLRRTAESVDLPIYLLDSSVAVSSVKGDSRMLPRVNNLSLAPTLKIPNNCKVGFSQLESEPETSKMPLLAVWGDRVILSSLLLERLHHLQLSLDDIGIKVGECISLGETGNVIPIDEYGYFTPTSDPAIIESHIISADITSVEESPVETRNAVLTASGVKADSYRAIESPVEQLAQLTHTPVYLEKVNYQRLSWWWEILIASSVALLLSMAVKRSVFVFWLWALVLGFGLFFGSIYLSAKTAYYAPILYLIVAIIVCMIVFLFLKKGVTASEKEEQFEQIDGTGSKLFHHNRKPLAKNRFRENRLQKKPQKSKAKTVKDQ